MLVTVATVAMVAGVARAGSNKAQLQADWPPEHRWPAWWALVVQN